MDKIIRDGWRVVALLYLAVSYLCFMAGVWSSDFEITMKCLGAGTCFSLLAVFILLFGLTVEEIDESEKR